MKEIHILNGQAMYDHFENIGFTHDKLMVPFNEAMCYGASSPDIFSAQFIKTRAEVHGVTPEHYKLITLEPLQPLFQETFNSIILWFDADMFCQINLLTILAWLEQMDYRNVITIHLVDDHFNIINAQQIEAKGYELLYKEVLLAKTMPLNIELALLRQGVTLYLSYLNPDSDLMMFIRKHKHLPETKLVTLLLQNFTHYGLGDTQYIELIRKNNDQGN